jgi:hypothetical protein
VPLSQRRLVRERLAILAHRQAFAGQGGLGGLQRNRLDQARIGRNGVAFLDADDVPGHQLLGRHAAPGAVADHVRLRGRHAPQGGQGLLGARLLDAAHKRIEQHHREDSDCLVRQRRVPLSEPQAGRDQRSGQQQDDQRVAELREELAPGGQRLLRGELVTPVALEPQPRLGVAQAAARVAAQRGEHRVGRLAIRIRFWRQYAKGIPTATARR